MCNALLGSMLSSLGGLSLLVAALPQDLWGKVMWVWDRPHVQKLRLTVSMANFRCVMLLGSLVRSWC